MIDKSIRQYYANGKKVDHFIEGAKKIAGKAGEELLTANIGKPASKFVTTREIPKVTEVLKGLAKARIENKLTQAALTKAGSGIMKTGALSFLGPLAPFAAMYLAYKAVGKVKDYAKDYAKTSKDKSLSYAPIVDKWGNVIKGDRAYTVDYVHPGGIIDQYSRAGEGFGVGASGKVSLAGLAYDKEHGAGSYRDKNLRDRISNIVASGTKTQTTIDKLNDLAKQLNLVDADDMSITTTKGDDTPTTKTTVEATAAIEDINIAPTVTTYTPPVRHHTGGGGGNQGGGYGQSPSDAPGTPFARGGRIDKPLTGRSRDI